MKVFVFTWLIAAQGAAGSDRTLEVERAWLDASHAFDADVRAFMVRYRTASESEQKRMLDSPDEPRHKWTPRMRALAQHYAGDCAAVRFDRWLLVNGRIVDARVADEAAARIVASSSCGASMMKIPGALVAASRVRGADRTLQDLAAIERRSSDARVRAESRRQADLLRNPVTPALRADDPAPPLRGKDLEGRIIDLEDLRGRVVLVDFWGAWCGPCLASMPSLRRLAARFESARFTIVGVNSDRDPAIATQVIRAQRVTWRNAADGGTDGPIAKAWKVSSWPYVFLVAKDGRIAAVAPPDDSLVAMIDRLLHDR